MCITTFSAKSNDQKPKKKYDIISINSNDGDTGEYNNDNETKTIKKERKPTFIERSFQKAGLRPIHVPAGLLIFNGMLWVEWLSVLVLSVRFVNILFII